jgi:hypothetical protein
MATDAQRAANRANARKSTGPRTRAGKARVANNARRHGFNRRVAADPAFAGEIEPLARRICGLGVAPAKREAADPVVTLKLLLARRIAEAQVDLNRVRRARHALIANALADPNYRSWRGNRARIEMLAQVGELLKLGVPVPDEMVRAFNHRHDGVLKHVLVLADHVAELRALDRYERRALSRRKFAAGAFDEALVALADPATRTSIDASSEFSVDLAVAKLLQEGRRARFPNLVRTAESIPIRGLLRKALTPKPRTAPAPADHPRHNPPSPELGHHGEGTVAF